ncbi:hypothetical protein SAMN06265339_1393 [Desulfurobacterium pacificum]|jgi:uncharacterized protein YoxC|uniref:Uncharacterized protein n=1 Tax=Desulfurobacterium pacificum TaxID=240166 RepID=A0ABY1NQ34_9BACT|nr:hypothetical protein [Desulfurobacterium pacificum]SMP15441.1 hypothetical protein SAMN06265339_1393 [Desulfurobacterium pacificum]
MVQLLLIILLIAVGGLFIFSIKLLFTLKEIIGKWEETESEIVKIKRQISDLEVKTSDLEERLKLLLSQIQNLTKEREE